MANAQRGEVAFEADGKPYTIHFGIDELCQIETAYNGKSVVEILADVEQEAKSGKLSVTRVRKIFAIGVGLSEQDVSPVINDLGLEKSFQLLGEALRLAFPDPSGEPGKPKAAA
jgi:hypothetical protein